MKGLAIVSVVSVLFVFGCATKVKTVEMPVPVKCKVPEVEPPKYQKPKSQAPVDILKVLLQNYEMCINYSKMLEEAIKVCE